MENKYTCTVIYCTKGMDALTKKELVRFKHLDNANNIDSFTNNGDTVTINVDYAVELDIHNPKGKDNTDYNKLVIVDMNGDMWATGSKGFIDTFTDIAMDMEGEEYAIIAMKKPCKNRSGEYLTCTLA